MPDLTRRDFIASLPLLPPVFQGASTPAPLRLRGFNHVSLIVSDLQRSIDFYRGLFGLALQSRQGSETAALQVGSGPQHIGLSTNPSSGIRTPRIDHLCLGVDGFELGPLLKRLADHGIPRRDQRGPLAVHVRTRPSELGGGPTGTAEVFLGDPDGVIVQLQDPRYCAGSGPLGVVCGPAVPSATKGLISPVAYSHCTVSSSDAQRSNAFYQRLFGVGIRSYQGRTAPTMAVGPGVEFLMNSGRNAAERPLGIHHFCLTLKDFDPERVVAALERFGLKPRESRNRPAGPLRHYITMRMEDRGGAKEGTPELYFTDPDGLLVQLQDVSYCGGSGVLGNVCS